MSLQHNIKLGVNDDTTFTINICRLDKESRRVNELKASIYAYDDCTLDSLFTCEISVNELRQLYQFFRSV